jgi:hypothetical protein
MGNERDQEQYEKNHEKQLRDSGGGNRYARKAQNRRDQCYYKERYRPVKHSVPPLMLLRSSCCDHHKERPGH